MSSESFFSFLLSEEKFAVRLDDFVEVRENSSESVLYNDKEIPKINLKKLLNLKDEKRAPVIVILRNNNDYIAIEVDSILDTITIDEKFVKSVKDMIKIPRPFIEEVILKNFEIIKVLSIDSLTTNYA